MFNESLRESHFSPSHGDRVLSLVGVRTSSRGAGAPAALPEVFGSPRQARIECNGVTVTVCVERAGSAVEKRMDNGKSV